MPLIATRLPKSAKRCYTVPKDATRCHDSLTIATRSPCANTRVAPPAARSPARAALPRRPLMPSARVVCECCLCPRCVFVSYTRVAYLCLQLAACLCRRFVASARIVCSCVCMRLRYTRAAAWLHGLYTACGMYVCTGDAQRVPHTSTLTRTQSYTHTQELYTCHKKHVRIL